MNRILLSPPVASVIVLAFCLLLSALAGKLAFRPRHAPKGGRKAYACGENVEHPRLQPNYAEFFPFAFFFTMLHVAALMIATAQTLSRDAIVLAVVYIAGAAIGLSILFRKGSTDEVAAQNTQLGKD